MKRFFMGRCSPENIFEARDPTVATESEFESSVVRGLMCLFRDYDCVIFSGGFEHKGIVYRPDLALVAKDYSHWFIIEVELSSHSFKEHVLPQVCAFRYGEPVDGCATSLASALNVSASQARTLLDFVPYQVAVVLNRHESEWEISLRSHDIQLLVVSCYSSSAGVEAIEVAGQLEVVSESLCFGEYFASVRALRIGHPIRIPQERVQIRDLYGNLAWYRVFKEGNETWISRENGTPEIGDRSMIQIIATGDGYLSMRSPASTAKTYL